MYGVTVCNAGLFRDHFQNAIQPCTKYYWGIHSATLCCLVRLSNGMRSPATWPESSLVEWELKSALILRNAFTTVTSCIDKLSVSPVVQSPFSEHYISDRSPKSHVQYIASLLGYSPCSAASFSLWGMEWGILPLP